MNAEALWYEYSPYFYVIAGIASMHRFRSDLAFYSGALLTLSATLILLMRWRHRRQD